MNKVLRFTLLGIAIIVLVGGLFFAGAVYARATGFAFPWMLGARTGFRMMGGGFGPSNIPRMGMMGGRNGFSMIGGYASNAGKTTPLTADQAKSAAGIYLTTLNNPDLKIAEVMIFDNNAYVRVIEQSTGIGAFELLVDPLSKVAYPEHGANMMWNLKYSGMNHSQMMGGSTGTVRGPGMMGGNGGMMGNYSSNTNPATVSADMPVKPAQALQIAQKYLDSALPGTKTATDADPFYGYYTIDFLRDSKTAGMLSVNGYSGQVILHIWHGKFIEEQTY